MNLKTKLSGLFALCLLTISTYAQSTEPIDHLGVKGPIIFNKYSYPLSWTAHPATNYYKQEYLAKGDDMENFHNLILLEVMMGDITLKDIVAKKVAELKDRGVANPIVKTKMLLKNGGIMLDFILTENAPDKKSIKIVERNVYLYHSILGKSGKKGILLFAFSERYYGKDIQPFLSTYKSKEMDLIKEVAGYKIPLIIMAK